MTPDEEWATLFCHVHFDGQATFLGNSRLDVPDPERPLEGRWEIIAAEEAEA